MWVFPQKIGGRENNIVAVQHPANSEIIQHASNYIAWFT
jgi:hypothetical protein